MRRFFLSFVLLWLAACAPTAATAPPATTTEPPQITVTPVIPTEISPIESPSMTPFPTPSDPALQEQVQQAVQDLSQRLGIPSEQVALVELQPVTWPDGSLGCPQPGMAYTQVQVDGLLIRLNAGDQVYEYHSGGSRAPFLCENPA